MSVQQTNLENNQARMDESLVSALEAVAKNQLDEGQVGISDFIIVTPDISKIIKKFAGIPF